MTFTDFLQVFLFGCASLFPMANPFSSIPMLLSLSERMTEEERRHQGVKAARNATIIMLVTLLLGSLILEFFQISLEALQSAGGLIVAYLGFRMLFPPESGAKGFISSAGSPDFSLIPLAMPGMAGPGTMAVLMSFSVQLRELSDLSERLWGMLTMILVILVVGGFAGLMLRGSARISRLLGQAGIDAMGRIMGLLLVCIGIQILSQGVEGFVEKSRSKQEVGINGEASPSLNGI